MSRRKRILIILLATIFVVCGSTSAVLVLYHWDEANTVTTVSVNESWQLPLGDGGNLTIAGWSYGFGVDVTITEHDGDMVYIDLVGTATYGPNSIRAPGLVAVEQDGSITIREIDRQENNYYLSYMSISGIGMYGSLSGRLNIVVPRGRLGDLQIEVPLGTVTASDLTCGAAIFSGNTVNLTGIVAASMNIDGHDSLVIVGGEVSGQLAINNGFYGTVSLTDTRAGSLVANVMADSIGIRNCVVEGTAELRPWDSNLTVDNLRCDDFSVNGHYRTATISNSRIKNMLDMSEGHGHEIVMEETEAGTVLIINAEKVNISGMKTDSLFAQNFYSDFYAQFDAAADIDIEGHGESVTLVLPQDMGFKLDVTTMGSTSDLDIDFPLTDIKTGYDTLSGTVGDGARTVKVNTWGVITVWANGE